MCPGLPGLLRLGRLAGTRLLQAIREAVETVQELTYFHVAWDLGELCCFLLRIGVAFAYFRKRLQAGFRGLEPSLPGVNDNRINHHKGTPNHPRDPQSLVRYCMGCRPRRAGAPQGPPGRGTAGDGRPRSEPRVWCAGLPRPWPEPFQ